MKYYQIADAAKKVNVESHVLRYWEDELELQIERNKQGHRLYTEEDLERFMYIKELKKEGLQLRAIREKVHKAEDWAGDHSVRDTEESEKKPEKKELLYSRDDQVMRIQVKGHDEERQEKAVRLCMMLQQMVGQAVKKENQEMLTELKKSVAESVSKEMDYQFRLQEQREEEHFQKVDELLRIKSGRKGFFRKNNLEKRMEQSEGNSSDSEIKNAAEETEEPYAGEMRMETETKEEIHTDKVKPIRMKEKRKKKKTKAQQDKEMLLQAKRRTSGV